MQTNAQTKKKALQADEYGKIVEIYKHLSEASELYNSLPGALKRDMAKRNPGRPSLHYNIQIGLGLAEDVLEYCEPEKEEIRVAENQKLEDFLSKEKC